ncbi:MAG: hypothetical protein IJG55_05820 [Synergistaceae bacterium]|nr:hypothetical protein [Synergistaceae bacterium]
MGNLTVSKFSGSSLSDSENVVRAMQIIKSDSSRRFVIISAPGKTSGEIGITDMLYMCHSGSANRENYNDILERVRKRYESIIDALGMNFDLEAEIKPLEKDLISGMSADHIAGRGEYIMAGIIAAYLGWERVDAADIIRFDNDGTLNESETIRLSRDKLRNMAHAVIPGFYGAKQNGETKTFPRKGGDITGGLIARSVNADLLEKWNLKTEIFSADPETVNDPAMIRTLTYSEALALNYAGIKTIHDSVIMLLKDTDMNVRVRSILKPDDEGTLITSEKKTDAAAVCITGRQKFNIIHIEKHGVNKICGIGEKLLGVFTKHKIACEHFLSGIHKLSFVLKTPTFDLRRNEILNDIRQAVSPESITVDDSLSLIAVIGNGMGTVKGKFAKIFSALYGTDINIRMVDQGADDLSIILGVDDKDYHKAVNALYEGVIMKG